MVPGSRAPGLPCARLPGCMKAALLASCMGGRWGGGGGGGGGLLTPHRFMIQTKKQTDDAFFQPELGQSVWRSLGWTKTMGRLNWRILDRLGRGMVAAMLTGGIRSWHFSAKTRKKGGRRGLRPWPLQCLSQFLSERIETA